MADGVLVLTIYLKTLGNSDFCLKVGDYPAIRDVICDIIIFIWSSEKSVNAIGPTVKEIKCEYNVRLTVNMIAKCIYKYFFYSYIYLYLIT